MRALVTGCAGFIGSHLTEALLADGVDVTGVDCFNDNYGRGEKLRNLERATDWRGFEFVPIDLARGDLLEFVDECDVVFHLAAEPGVRPSWGQRFEQYLRNNVLATQHLLEATRHSPETRFVYASSSSIYGDAESFPTAEEVIPRPFSPYGVTKLSGEHLCALYQGNHDLATVSLRFFSVYGPRQRPDMAFNIFSRAILEGRPITIFGDGTQTRDFTFVGDVVESLRLAATSENAVGETFNVGGGSQVSLNEAIDLLAQAAGAAPTVNRGEWQHGDVHNTCADPTRIAGALGFAPAMALADGLAEQFEWMRETVGSEPAAPR